MTVVSITHALPAQPVHTSWCTEHADDFCGTTRRVTRSDTQPLAFEVETFSGGPGYPINFHIGGKHFDRDGAEALRRLLDELLSVTSPLDQKAEQALSMMCEAVGLDIAEAAELSGVQLDSATLADGNRIAGVIAERLSAHH